jgi:hypothetical protein
MGLSSLLVVVPFRGCALAKRTPGVAPKPWRSACTPARFFHSVLLVREVFVSVGPDGAMRAYRHLPAFGYV